MKTSCVSVYLMVFSHVASIQQTNNITKIAQWNTQNFGKNLEERNLTTDHRSVSEATKRIALKKSVFIKTFVQLFL